MEEITDAHAEMVLDLVAEINKAVIQRERPADVINEALLFYIGIILAGTKDVSSREAFMRMLQAVGRIVGDKQFGDPMEFLSFLTDHLPSG